MKKIFLCTFITILGTLLITGCGKNLSNYAGTYKLEYSKYVGDSDEDKDTTEIANIVLNSDGTGKSNRNDTSYDVEWSMNGENITLIEKFMGIKIEYNGTIKDNVLDLFNGDKSNALTNETVYKKQ